MVCSPIRTFSNLFSSHRNVILLSFGAGRKFFICDSHDDLPDWLVKSFPKGLAMTTPIFVQTVISVTDAV
jgi:hypothetical protein